MFLFSLSFTGQHNPNVCMIYSSLPQFEGGTNNKKNKNGERLIDNSH